MNYAYKIVIGIRDIKLFAIYAEKHNCNKITNGISGFGINQNDVSKATISIKFL